VADLELNTGEDSPLGEQMLSQADLDALIAAATSDEPESLFGETASEGSLLGEGAGAGLVDFPEFPMPAAPPAPASPAPSSPASGGSTGMNRVRDIPLEVTVELGRTRLLIRDILDLSPGSIIELDKLAGEPVDLLANGMLVARGEVIVIDDNFGVRVTEIITAAERQLGKGIHGLAA